MSSDWVKKRDHGDGDPDAPMYRELLGLVEQMRPPRPIPARLFVGRLAHEAFRMVSTPAQGREWDSWWVFGVQVVLRDDFDWRQWQLWSSEGELLREGTVE